MKKLYCLLIILLSSTPLYADQALVLTEIEKIQESIWYLQKDLAAQNTEFKKFQAQLGVIVAQSKDDRRLLNERINAIQGLVESQQAEVRQTNQRLENLKQALASLADGDNSQQDVVLEQAQKIQTQEKSLQDLRTRLSDLQTGTSEAITRTQRQLEDTQQQLEDTRSQVAALGQDIGGRVEKIGILGAGALLILAIGLTIGLAFRKGSGKRDTSELKHPTNHEM